MALEIHPEPPTRHYNKHGRELENWWRERFGFDFDRLTRSEARYLQKTQDADTIRDRIVAAGPEIGS